MDFLSLLKNRDMQTNALIIFIAISCLQFFDAKILMSITALILIAVNYPALMKLSSDKPQVKQEIKKHTDRPIVFRNKPRPGNEWWETDIKEQLKYAHCLVTNMSLSGVDALMNMVPVFAEGSSIMGPVSSRDISKIEKPLRPGRKTMEEWMKFVAENQFTIKEIENGTAYKILKVQNEN